MPRLLFMIPCDKVLTDEGNLLSIITVLETVTITTPPGQQVPANAFATNPWHVVIQWLATREENQKEFEQRLQIFAPNDEEFGGAISKFKVTQSLHRDMIEVPGFPIGTEGACLIRLALREVGVEEWNSIMEYPIQIAHEVTRETTEEGNIAPALME